MSENVQENKEPQSTDTAGFTPINSQEELDRIIGNRLALLYLPGCFPAPKSSHRRRGVARLEFTHELGAFSLMLRLRNAHVRGTA